MIEVLSRRFLFGFTSLIISEYNSITQIIKPVSFNPLIKKNLPYQGMFDDFV
jgi:hypothetical protein